MKLSFTSESQLVASLVVFTSDINGSVFISCLQKAGQEDLQRKQTVSKK